MTLYNPEQALEQIAAGLKQVAFDPIPELNGYDFPTAAPQLPAAMVMPPPITYREAMRIGVVRLDFEIWLMVGSAAGHEQQKTLWPYLNWSGARSLLALLDANPSLGIVGADGLPRVDAHVMTSRPLGLDDMPPFESMVFGEALTVPVHVTNRK